MELWRHATRSSTLPCANTARGSLTHKPWIARSRGLGCSHSWSQLQRRLGPLHDLIGVGDIERGTTIGEGGSGAQLIPEAVAQGVERPTTMVVGDTARDESGEPPCPRPTITVGDMPREIIGDPVRGEKAGALDQEKLAGMPGGMMPEAPAPPVLPPV